MPEEKPTQPKDSEDIQELRQVLGTVAEFMYQIKDLVKEFLDTLSKSFDGEKLGREVAQMYKSLVDSGMPPDKAYELTQKFLETKLQAIPKVSSFIEMLQKSMTGGAITGGAHPPIIIAKTKGKPKIVRLEKKEEGEGGYEIRIEGEEEKEKRDSEEQ